MQGADADKAFLVRMFLIFLNKDAEVSQLIVQRAQRPTQQKILVSKVLQQLVYFLYITHAGIAYHSGSFLNFLASAQNKNYCSIHGAPSYSESTTGSSTVTISTMANLQ
jgi:hypothetical protein